MKRISLFSETHIQFSIQKNDCYKKEKIPSLWSVADNNGFFLGSAKQVSEKAST